MKHLAVAAVLVIACNAPAEARKLRHQAPDAGCVYTNSGRVICGPAAAASRRAVARNDRAAVARVDQGTIIGGRPPDCPRSYCGCGLRKYLGLSDKRLNLARNWARLFPRATGPAAGLAAVRSGHVMYIEAAAGDGQWLVRDYNSGGGLSRLHVRDVRGYIFVNPRGGLNALASSLLSPG